MTAFNLGMKRTCLGCTARFYDLWKNPSVCPECGHVLEINYQTKGRRSKASSEPKVKADVVPIAELAQDPFSEEADDHVLVDSVEDIDKNLDIEIDHA